MAEVIAQSGEAANVALMPRLTGEFIPAIDKPTFYGGLGYVVPWGGGATIRESMLNNTASIFAGVEPSETQQIAALVNSVLPAGNINYNYNFEGLVGPQGVPGPPGPPGVGITNYVGGAATPSSVLTSDIPVTDGIIFHQGGQLDISANLVAHWLLNETTGTTVDNAEGTAGLDGTSSTDASNLTATGKTNTCFDLDGQYSVAVDDDAALSFDDSGSNPFSIWAWIYVTSTPGTRQYILSKSNQNSIREWALYLTVDGKLRMSLIDETDGGGRWRTTDAALSEGWHLVVATYDSTGGTNAATGITLYVDGSAVNSTVGATGTYTQMRDTAIGLLIGAIYTTTGTTVPTLHFANKIDNVGIVGEELSAANITKLWSYGSGTEDVSGAGTAKVLWTTGVLRYKGIEYTIASEITGDTNKYIYWDLDSSNTTFKTTNTLADILGADKWAMCYNDGGTPYPAAGNKIMHGGIIEADTIDTVHLNALSITTEKINGLAVETEKIADDATKVYETAYTAGSINLQVQTEVTVQTLTYTSLGGMTQIFGSMMWHYTSSTTSSTGVHLYLYYGSTLIAQWDGTFNYSPDAEWGSSISAVHFPPAGSVTYYLKAEYDTVASDAIDAKFRSMSADESKGK